MTSLSQSRNPNLIRDYENAVIRLTQILQCSGVSFFYTHHIDLLHYCLKCPAIPNNLINQVLDLWLRKSDGDVKSLLSFNCDKVIRKLLVSRLFIRLQYCYRTIIFFRRKHIQFFLCCKKQNNIIFNCFVKKKIVVYIYEKLNHLTNRLQCKSAILKALLT